VSDDLSIPNPGYRGSRAGRYGTGRIRIHQGMDPDTRRLMMFAGALGAVLVVLISASALIGRHTGEVPVVSADPRPIREKPVNPGGMKIDGAENDVFSGRSDTSNARLAPAPESPNAQALRAEAVPTATQLTASPDAPDRAVAAAPVSASPTVAAPMAAAPAAVVPAAGGAGRTVVAPVAKPAAVASAPAKPTPTPVPAPVVAKPAVAEAAHPVQTGHTPTVQLAALGSEEAAHTEWTQLTKKMPELLGGKQPNYTRVERDGHSFWRLRTSGFADVAQARSFCDHVRAKGGGCSVADF
jgi:hypothetical protein